MFLSVSILTNAVCVLRISRPDIWARIPLHFVSPPQVQASDHVRGSVDADTSVILYSDFQCPFSRDLYKALSRERDSINFALVYRHYTLDEIHPMAKRIAEAAECAGAQGKFWEYADVLFEEHGELSEDDLYRFASSIGLDMVAFDKDLASRKFQERVAAQRREAEKKKIGVVPTFYVNGKRHVGSLSEEALRQLLRPGVEFADALHADVSTSVEGGVPKLVCDAPVFDIGNVASELSITHAFVVRNEGGGVLRITDVRFKL